jgi:hypothetical protein
MEFLLIIVFITLGLAVRTRAVTRSLSPVAEEVADESGLMDATTRTSLLVLLCLIGLLALGLMYGNVLGAGSASL